MDQNSGLEFWATDDNPEEIELTIWKLFLSGTRHHWAWPCPHCGEFFIPRFRCLGWKKPKGANGKELPSTPALAASSAHLVCPRNGCVIFDGEKAGMNARGVYVAPGQSISSDGTVEGPPPENWTVSFWASGLASPFVTWGERAAAYVTAVRSREHGKIQAVVNGGFAEVFAPGDGEVPEWHEVAWLRELGIPYHLGDTPDGVRVVTMAVDVQKDRLVYTVHGWGVEATSGLLDAGDLFGDTEGEEVWEDLAGLMQATWAGMPVRLTLIDSGFRPGKKEIVPEHRVYQFCRRFPHSVRATKGSSAPMRRPVQASKIDVKINGREFKRGLDLIRLDADHFKSLVHGKIRWPEGAPGAWYLPVDISDDFCMQLVSEARMKTASGKVKWIERSRDNHFLDCLAMQAAAAMILNLQAIRDDNRQASLRRARRTDLGSVEPGDEVAPAKPLSPARVREPRSGFLPRESIW